MSSSSHSPITRRGLLQIGAAVSGGLMIRMWLPDEALAATPGAMPTTFKPNAWLIIDRDRGVTFFCNQAEMGQGVHTSLATIIAEELEYHPRRIHVQFAPADRAYDNPALGVQATGGSTSVKFAYQPLREAGAYAREMIKIAASRRWRVPVAEIEAEDGQVRHSSGKSATYEQLAVSAAGVYARAVDRPALKPPEQFKYIGKPLPRLDLGAKVEGSAQFGMDVKVPGMKVAVVSRCPVIGGTVKAVDDAEARAMPGVEAVVNIGYGVGVVASTYWHARQAAEKLKVTWDEGPLAKLSSASIREMMVKAVASGQGKEAKNKGDARGAIAAAAKKLSAIYEAPYLAHAPMEPMNATAHVSDAGCEIWAPTQSASIARQVAMEELGLPAEKISVHPTFLGGGFGRRVGYDFITDAVRLSRAVKKPVKVVWSREEDMRFGQYRPVSYHELSGGVDAQGNIVGVVHKLASPSILAQLIGSFMRAAMPDGMPGPIKGMAAGAIAGMMRMGVDTTSVEGAASTEYDLPAHRVEWYSNDPGIPLAFWRSVGHSFNAFVVESFIDELAHAGGRDPLEVRRALLEKKPRHRGVLEQVAAKAGWGKPLPAGVFRGLAQHESFDSYAAAVAEVSVDKEDIKVHRIVIGIDCGRVINPDIVAQQLESAAIYGLTAALKGQLTVENGGIVQSNFHDYEMVRFHEAPAIETVIVQSEEKPTGTGEPGVPVIAPAVANAVFAATGRRLRKLPLSLGDAGISLRSPSAE
jgi:CO/xanthine dehydrogenase Mo-binding subunit